MCIRRLYCYTGYVRSKGMYLFLKSFFIGLLIAIPVGPIGILCIRRSLVQGFVVGLATGLGAALGDGVYAVIATLGLTFISHFLLNYQHIFITIGSLFLYYLGIKSMMAKPLIEFQAINKSRGFITTTIETFLLTLANPITIISSTALFVGFGLAEESNSYRAAAIISCGIFLGSASWFFSLSAFLSFFRSRCSTTVLDWINKVSGIMLIVFATVALIGLLLTKQYTFFFKARILRN